MLERKITFISFYIALTILGLMWAVFLLDFHLDLNLWRFGVYPKHSEGLYGILFSPFIHSTEDYAHVLNNSFPALILTWLIFYHYRTIATKSFVLIYLLSGVGLWLLGRESWHIGMSGVIYGMTSFLVFSGFFRKNLRVAAVSLIVIFLYGSLIWGIFPVKEHVSWEAHLTGLFSGIIVSILFKNKGPQPKKLFYEIEEELGIEPEHEYWNNEPKQPKPVVNQPRIIINYEIVPKRVIPVDEEE